MTSVLLLVNSPNEGQQLISVGITGGYFDVTRVIWDERLDGPIPEGIIVGGMVRYENPARLEYSQELFDLNDPTKQPMPGNTLVTPFQLESALQTSGHLSVVLSQLHEWPPAAQIEWRRRTQIPRGNHVGSALSEGLDLTAKEVDDIFRIALEVN